MTESKGWEWEKANQEPWLKPTEDVYYLAEKWAGLGFRRVLDLGSGLGRHAIFLAQRGFEALALDLSEYGINHIKAWAERENLKVDARVGDMLALPYADGSIDCVLAYHSISHTDTPGIKKIIRELERVLKPGGEIYLSLCSKEARDYNEAWNPRIDENSLLCKEEGPDYDVPHFYADRELIPSLFAQFDIDLLRHIEYCVIQDQRRNGKYYYLNARKKTDIEAGAII